MLRIYARLWQINWAEQWQYRASLFMYVLYGLISPIVFLSVWRTIAQSQGQVQGLTANDFTLYYLVLLAVSNLTGEITIHILAYRIQDGTLSGELIKPIHPILTTNLISNLAYKSLTIIALTPVWIVLALLFRPDFSAVTPLNLLLGMLATVLGFGISYFMGAIVTCVAFWTTRSYTVSEFFYAFTMLLGGLFVPLELLPQAVQAFARLMPFQLFLYFPVQLILGRLTSAEVLQNFGLQLFWLAVFYLGLRLIWRAGVKQFSAVGA